jgi:Flp pilus assembly protein TadB
VTSAVLFVVAGLAAAAAVILVRATVHRRIASARLRRARTPEDGGPDRDVQLALPRRRWLAAIAGAVVAVLGTVGGLPLALVASFALVAAILTGLAEDVVHGRRLARIETQLADAIDLLIGAMRAGSSAVAALDAARRGVASPLRAQLEEVVGRLKLGDDPGTVLGELTARVPLETFRLFALTMTVHWEAGGSLAPALATTARTIRDRIDLSRRVQTQARESQVSVIAFLAIVYGLGYILWQANPERMHLFLASTAGTGIVAGAVLLQAIGLLWMSRVVRVRF